MLVAGRRPLGPAPLRPWRTHHRPMGLHSRHDSRSSAPGGRQGVSGPGVAPRAGDEAIGQGVGAWLVSGGPAGARSSCRAHLSRHRRRLDHRSHDAARDVAGHLRRHRPPRHPSPKGFGWIHVDYTGDDRGEHWILAVAYDDVSIHCYDSAVAGMVALDRHTLRGTALWGKRKRGYRVVRGYPLGV
jgi:hypothetical protein